MKIKNYKLKIKPKNKGAIITLALVFGLVFLILLSSLLLFILLQIRQSNQRLAWQQAFQISEAGINYFRWCLNNGVEDQCSLEKEYFDPEGNFLGWFSLEISSDVCCGETVKREIVSTGWTESYPQTKRRIKVLYARSSVAKYVYLLNDNVWAGPDREIRGLYHSNGGIRMDGQNQSLVSSGQPEWTCTGSFGCDPCPTADGCWLEGSSCLCPGVFTTTENSRPELFEFPAALFDFAGISVDLVKIKARAQASSLYLPPAGDINPQAEGYHLIFQDNGSTEVRIITQLWSDWAYSIEEGWHYDYFRIGNEYFYNSYSMSSDCPVIFIEDNLWLEGEVKGKITLASANIIDSNKDADVVLRGNIIYTADDGSDGLALIAQRNVLIAPDSSDTLQLKGIFIAQKGRFGRNHYPDNIREELDITGSIVSNGRVGTQWTSGSEIVSGYRKRESYFDQNLIYEPPPFVPYAEYDFKIINWEEVE